MRYRFMLDYRLLIHSVTWIFCNIWWASCRVKHQVLTGEPTCSCTIATAACFSDRNLTLIDNPSNNPSNSRLETLISSLL